MNSPIRKLCTAIRQTRRDAEKPPSPPAARLADYANSGLVEDLRTATQEILRERDQRTTNALPLLAAVGDKQHVIRLAFNEATRHESSPATIRGHIIAIDSAGWIRFQPLDDADQPTHTEQLINGADLTTAYPEGPAEPQSYWEGLR